MYKDACTGPADDVAIARALGAAFHAISSHPMPHPAALQCDAPDTFPRPAFYRAAPTWARYLVHFQCSLRDDDRRPCTQRFFYDRATAEEFARESAHMLGKPGDQARTHGYVSVGALDRRMKRWEALGSEPGWGTDLESPDVYMLLDPGCVVERSREPNAGYGEVPARYAWDRTWCGR